MANRWGNNGNSDRLYFLGLQNHCRWWRSHEIKRRLLLGRKAMTNLHSVLKSREITLLTKVHLVKAMVFPAVIYGCVSWERSLSAEELMLFELRCWRKLLRVPWTARRSNQSVLNIHLEGLMLKLKLQYFGHQMRRADHLKRPCCWERLKAGGEGDDRGRDGLNGHEFEQALEDGEGQRSLACCSPRGHKEWTWLTDWTTKCRAQGTIFNILG